MNFLYDNIMNVEIEYRAYLYMLEMLSSRNYKLIKTSTRRISDTPTDFYADLSSLSLSFDEFRDKIELDIPDLWDADNNTYVYLKFKSLGGDDNIESQLKTVLNVYSLKLEDITQIHVIYIDEDTKLLATLYKKYYEKYTGYNFEVFNLKSLSIYYMHHKYQSKTTYIRRGTDENKRLITKYGNNMKIVFSNDPVAKYYHAQEGDIILYDDINYRKVKDK